MKIGVIGAGRLGICFALLCEQAGYEVVVSDIRDDYVKALQNKQIETNEPEVLDLLKKSVNLNATTSNIEVIKQADIIYCIIYSVLIFQFGGKAFLMLILFSTACLDQ